MAGQKKGAANSRVNNAARLLEMLRDTEADHRIAIEAWSPALAPADSAAMMVSFWRYFGHLPSFDLLKAAGYPLAAYEAALEALCTGIEVVKHEEARE